MTANGVGEKSVRIGTPFIERQGGRACLKANVAIGDGVVEKWVRAMQDILKDADCPADWRYDRIYQPQGREIALWYAVDERFGDKLSADRADAFVAGLMYFAMVSGADMYSEAPVSARLLFHFRHQLLPALCREADGFSPIRIVCDAAGPPAECQGAVGTALSFGVDSLATLHLYTQPDVPERFRLTHLTLLNAGALHPANDYRLGKTSFAQWNDVANSRFQATCRQVAQVAKSVGLDFVYVDSNLNDLYQGGFDNSHILRNCSAALALQGLFGVYYYSTNGHSSDSRTHRSLRSAQSEYQEALLAALSTDSLSFFSGGYGYDRLEKTRLLADDPLAQAHLYVCTKPSNCGVCHKCRRTIVALDALGALDRFGAVFNLKDYEKRRWRDECWVLDQRRHNDYAAQVDLYRRRHGIGYSLKSRARHLLCPLRRLRLWRNGASPRR